jgi:hypothetical protein
VAIYALSIKHRTKGQGATAGAHALYIAREGKYARLAESRAQSHADYLMREGSHSRRSEELVATWSGNLPEWAGSAREFWSAADTYERANGRVYTEVVISLPRELSPEGREAVTREFIEREIGTRFTYTAAIHNPRALDGGEQPHAHIMFSIRERDGIARPKQLYFRRANPKKPALGGAKKNREWSLDDRKNDRVRSMRATWEKLVNRALEREGHAARVDRRSLKEQGIEREPEPKMGPQVTQKVKRGQVTEIGDRVKELREERQRQREIKGLEQELRKEKARVHDFETERKQRLGDGGDGFWVGGPKREVSEEERQQYRRTVDLVCTRYQKEDGTTEYRWKKSGTVAFVDRGDRIDVKSVNETAIKAALQVAKEKGWQEIHATGSEEFRREAWTQAQLMGMGIRGYTATASDVERVEALKKEQEQKRAQYRTQEKGPQGPGDKTEFVSAKVLLDDVDKQIAALREQSRNSSSWNTYDEFLRSGAVRYQLDELYREKAALKTLGDEKLAVQRGKDGYYHAIDRVGLRRRSDESGHDRTRGRGRGR